MAFVSPQNETKHNQVQTCFRVAQFINEPQAYILKAKKTKIQPQRKQEVLIAQNPFCAIAA